MERRTATNPSPFNIPACLRPLLTLTRARGEVYSVSRGDRERRFNLLVRRFINQIQYGCQNPQCEVRTCLSYRQRHTSCSLRPFNDLTARIMAWQCVERYGDELAVERKPVSATDGLCWSEPVVPWHEDPNQLFHQRLDSPASEDDRPYGKERIFDQSSFTQSLYSESNIAKYDFVTHQRETKVSQRVLVFRILTPSVIVWMRATSALPAATHIEPPLRSVDSRQSTKEETLTTPQASSPRQRYVAARNSFREVMLNSLHFTFSHPLRLLESAQYWHTKMPGWEETMMKMASSYSDQPISEEEEEDINRYIHTVTLFESSDEVPSPVKGFPAWSSLKSTCGTVLRTALEYGADALLNDIFAAIQHAFALPASLERRTSTSSAQQSEILRTDFLADSCVARLLILAVSIVDILCELAPSCDQMFLQNPHPKQDLDWKSKQPPTSSVLAAVCESGQFNTPTTFDDLEYRFSTLPQPDAYERYLEALIGLHNPNASRLLVSVAKIISHRLSVSSALRIISATPPSKEVSPNLTEEIVMLLLRLQQRVSTPSNVAAESFTQAFFGAMHFVIFSSWNREPTMKRTDPATGALEMMAALWRNRKGLRIDPEWFQLAFLAEALDEVELPLSFLSFKRHEQRVHLLQFPCLFEPATLVRYFRAINLKTMQQSHEDAMVMQAHARQHLLNGRIPTHGVKEVLQKTRPLMAKFFVMTIRRGHIIEDAINQIWRRERRELMRPLKVRFGKDEGEDGLDHGGVQQEFLRLFFAQALDVRYGMFTFDEPTRMTWFRAGSTNPLYQFEALGVLMSLAVYNAITLPVTFPLALYRKLLGQKVKLADIDDGWPILARGLKALLDWADGDVGDVMARTYEFSYDGFESGKTVTVDMRDADAINRYLQPAGSRNPDHTAHKSSKHKPNGTVQEHGQDHLTNKGLSPTEIGTGPETGTEAALVTNANRGQYVRDYISWLTDISVHRQYEAFAKGFHTCLNRTALSIFTPEALKLVVEGHQEIDVEELRRATVYDDYSEDDRVIQDFWQVVNDFSPEQHRKLLEFVTASDRVPVNGINSVNFLVQKNGEGDERLPSSSTCYGRLLLPNYTSKATLQAKLEKAIENSIGFGAL